MVASGKRALLEPGEPDLSSKKSRPLEQPPKPEPKKSLYVNNINDSIKLGTLRESLFLMFSAFGEVLQVKVSKATRGQAFVVLKSADEANLAMTSLQKEPFFGKPLHIGFARTESNLVATTADGDLNAPDLAPHGVTK
ncbi:LAME_0F09010g1_1 [Lachancea meyersii CBS 8951]|uniref:LAME_0F09010g1_1 n=1 Tax=Lachancea meyersii CBS 8951 TaxID=1266667 RepID=A0A1G4JUZ6_9SACH|nr:LAME_0F09010g1_1 [Lachancea meyersii CBS 8951]